MNAINKYIRFGQFWKDRADFYRDIAEALRENELLRDFVDGELSTGDRRTARYRALKHIQSQMRLGERDMATLLGSIMPNGDALSLNVLRTATDKETVLMKIADAIEIERIMTATLVKALTGPAFLVFVCVAFVWVMVTKTLPAFEAAAPAGVWVGFPWLVRAVSQNLRDFGVHYLFAVAAFWLWMIGWGFRNWRNMLRFKIENCKGWRRASYTLATIPFGPFVQMLTFYRDYQASKMLGSLALILSSGRQVQDAIQELVPGSSPWMKKHLRLILLHLQIHPGDYAGAFSKGVLSDHLKARMLTKTRRDAGGAFESVLLYLGTTSQIQSREAFMKNSTRLNSVLLTISLGVISFLYIGQTMIAQSIQDQFSPSAIERRASSPANPGP